jgi:hypothetical protein
LIPPDTTLEGRYRLLHLLGEGAMGAVYEADDVVSARRVALKVLHLRFARSAEAVGRFTREARAAASIGHPHIVAVTDFGAYEERPFLVMELLRGETLGERVARELTLAPADACAVVGQVLSALAAAHAIGVVHRDLKPDNVFLCEGSGAVKLLDFGVSKFHPPGEGAALVTQDGVPIGTPSYMAPEQWTGQRDVDLRADLYAMGAMLYELLTGALPFEARSTGQLYGVVVHGTAAPRAPSEVVPDVPAALDAVVLRAVSRDRALRFQTAEDFLDALRPFGATAAVLPVTAARVHFPSSAPPPPLTTPEERPASREGAAPARREGWAVVVVAALVVAVAAFALRGRRATSRAPMAAVVEAPPRESTLRAAAAASPPPPLGSDRVMDPSDAGVAALDPADASDEPGGEDTLDSDARGRRRHRAAARRQRSAVTSAGRSPSPTVTSPTRR